MLSKVGKGILIILEYFGFYPKRLLVNLSNIGWYLKNYRSFKQLNTSSESQMRFGIPMPILTDHKVSSGSLSGHYFHQDLIVAQSIFRNNPQKHIDIGSRTDGFVTHVASFREIEVFDIRPSEVEIENIKFIQCDFMDIPPTLHNYADSVSCLHVIEHFGLGRYGDPIDPDGHLKGLNSIYKVLKPGGKFYFSTPIGNERINFNAHRVFGLSRLIDLFKDNYQIDRFHYVDDSGDLHKDVDLTLGVADSFNCTWGCGIFEMTKL